MDKQGSGEAKNLGSETPPALDVPNQETGLAPCPFCKAGKIELIKYESPVDGALRWRPSCMNEDCDFYDAQYPSFGTKREAVKVWNKRADDKWFAEPSREGWNIKFPDGTAIWSNHATLVNAVVTKHNRSVPLTSSPATQSTASERETKPALAADARREQGSKREIEFRSIIGFAVGALEGLQYQVPADIFERVESVISEIARRESLIPSLSQTPTVAEENNKPVAGWIETAERPPTKEDADDSDTQTASETRRQAKFKIGQRVWFTKSMRLCTVEACHKDGTYSIERCDTGKRMLATEDGLSPA